MKPWLFVLAISLAATAYCAPQSQARLARIKRLYASKQWAQVVRLTAPAPSDAPTIDYYRGMALARLGRYSQARNAFLRGWKKAPRDKRFPSELAGIAFSQKKYGAAKSYLKAALKIDPHDAYAANFLATLYDLDGNIPAALQYWNRISQPKIRAILRPRLQINPVLLNEAFAFSPGATLELGEWRATEARLGAMGIFIDPSIRLQPLSGGQFDAVFSPIERVGLLGSKWQAAVSLLRGAPYDTVYPSFFNIHGSTTNIVSLLRWDPQKERIFAALDGPVRNSARWRYRVYLDGRRENWNLSTTFFGAREPVSNLQLEKIEGGAEIESIAGGRFRWRTGIDLSGRQFRRAPLNVPSAAAFFKNGFALEYRAGLDALLFDLPGRRFSMDSTAAMRFGKLFTGSLSPFLQGEAGVRALWFPQARGDDYEITARFRAGATSGVPPFDDLFMLGLERDNNLWLRAHPGTEDGRKGSAPLGRNFALFNSTGLKNLFSNGIIRLKLGPFFDAGKIGDPSQDFGSRGWILNTGLEFKAQVLGDATLELFFGEDLRTGRTSFYGLTEPLYGNLR